MQAQVCSPKHYLALLPQHLLQLLLGIHCHLDYFTLPSILTHFDIALLWSNYIKEPRLTAKLRQRLSGVPLLQHARVVVGITPNLEPEAAPAQLAHYNHTHHRQQPSIVPA